MDSEYYWPAEWETQTATWIAWPHHRETWPGYFAPVPATFVKFIAALSQVQRVEVLAGPTDIDPAARQHVSHLPRVTVHDIVTNDVWIRDYGPTFVKRRRDDQLVGINWIFNSWGGKYPPFDDDAAAATRICRAVGIEVSDSPLCCEGGGLETNGRGTLLTTSSVLLSPARNPNWSRDEIERELKLRLGVTQIIWVDGGGLAGDDTDGHIDQLARFVNTDTLVVAVSSERSDSNFDGLQENYRQLSCAHDANGQRMNTIPLPTPAPRLVDGKRVPESYCNFLIANGIVIVPTFRAATDEPALRLIEQLMPDRRIVPLDAFDLIWGLGAFHCASQQQPA